MMLDLFSPYPATSGFKEPTTSRAAARKVDAGDLKQIIYQRVREQLRCGGMTAKELSAAIGFDKDQVKPRLTELKLKGVLRWQRDAEGDWVIANGEHVWELV